MYLLWTGQCHKCSTLSKSKPQIIHKSSTLRATPVFSVLSLFIRTKHRKKTAFPFREDGLYDLSCRYRLTSRRAAVIIKTAEQQKNDNDYDKPTSSAAKSISPSHNDNLLIEYFIKQRFLMLSYDALKASVTLSGKKNIPSAPLPSCPVLPCWFLSLCRKARSIFCLQGQALCPIMELKPVTSGGLGNHILPVLPPSHILCCEK